MSDDRPDFSEYERPRLARLLHTLLPTRAWQWLQPTEDDRVRAEMRRQAMAARAQLRAKREAEVRQQLGLPPKSNRQP